MNFSDFITNHGKRVNKEHYIHFIQVSKSDGKKHHTALMIILKRFAIEAGFSDKAIDNCS